MSSTAPFPYLGPSTLYSALLCSVLFPSQLPASTSAGVCNCDPRRGKPMSMDLPPPRPLPHQCRRSQVVVAESTGRTDSSALLLAGRPAPRQVGKIRAAPVPCGMYVDREKRGQILLRAASPRRTRNNPRLPFSTTAPTAICPLSADFRIGHMAEMGPLHCPSSLFLPLSILPILLLASPPLRLGHVPGVLR